MLGKTTFDYDFPVNLGLPCYLFSERKMLEQLNKSYNIQEESMEDPWDPDMRQGREAAVQQCAAGGMDVLLLAQVHYRSRHSMEQNFHLSLQLRANIWFHIEFNLSAPL